MRKDWSYEATKLQDVMVCGEYKRGVVFSPSMKCVETSGFVERITSKIKAFLDREYDTKIRMEENKVLVKKSEVLEDELTDLNLESKQMFGEIKELRAKYETLPAPMTYHVIPRIEGLLKKIRVVHVAIERKVKELDEVTCKINKNNIKIAKNNNRS